MNSIYAKYIKRILDFVISFMAIVLLSPLMLLLVVITAIAMKGYPFFIQKRPGKIDPKTGKERIINLVKIRTMTNEVDKETGKLLPDSQRLTKYGKFLRSTSLDEILELFNCLSGSMSLVGPRPQLFRDLVFMNEEQRRRHTVQQGITGLAQVNGRNKLSWEKKFYYDLKYIDDGITFIGDLKIVLKTFNVIIRHDDISEEGCDTSTDFGDYLLEKGKISKAEYNQKQEEARMLVK